MAVAEIAIYGDGSGDGSGYGDGYGYGSGDGYGYGDGDGSGYGDGYGDGDGYGYGYGYGDGYGYGSGDGYGYGYDPNYLCALADAYPPSLTITRRWLKQREACSDQVALFSQVFPTGSAEPTGDNLRKALESGLNLSWLFEAAGYSLWRIPA